MNTMLASYAADIYKDIDRSSGIEAASPHKLIDMLMTGALDKIASAKGHIQRNNIAEKGKDISDTISIIQGLIDGLNFDVDNDLVGNLESLYDYMQRQLLYANLTNNIEKLDEVSNLLGNLQDGWQQIPREMHYSHQTAEPG